MLRKKMFGKTKWLIAIALVLACMACDLESENKGGGNQGDSSATPGVPTNVRAAAVSSTSISVTWNVVSGATSYDVYYETGSLPISKVNTVSGNSYTHTGLTPSTTYSYYIRAVNDAGSSDYSSRASATTQSAM